jgi:hypothetical protein
MSRSVRIIRKTSLLRDIATIDHDIVDVPFTASHGFRDHVIVIDFVQDVHTEDASLLRDISSADVIITWDESAPKIGTPAWIHDHVMIMKNPMVVFLLRSVRIMRNASQLHVIVVANSRAAPRSQNEPHLSGLARLEAPAVRSTDRILRRPKS